ncbi:MAG TPA: UDP-N-acetylmuramoyl-tripeptide--D-alanyl-D-alanine ligase [Candidatus Babeliales bacterium]|nr:UDP-N-acetylmuramoyl-tripeptide--D-alanyl-D-alanine ligase [Candidatus Babeliales bacterium]
MRFDEHFIQGALTEVSIVNAVFPLDPQFSIDTRTLKQGDIFFALPGAQVDGHDFVADAIKKGAGGICIAHDKKDILKTVDADVLKKKLILVVPKPEYALIRLATVWRSFFNYPVVAITGSVGKTSTKELLAHVLDMHGIPYMVSFGNQNTKIGVALNILRMRTSHKVAIFEVGINKRNEMARISDILRPTTAVITKIGHSHMEGLGSVVDIALEKRDVFKYFTAENIGVINGDQLLLSQVGYPHPVLKFGTKTTNQIQARKIHIGTSATTFTLKIYKEKYNISIANVHEGAVFNSLAVASVAHLLGVPAEGIVAAINAPPVISGRFETRAFKDKSKGALIDDCYSANPESMKAALLAFQKIDTRAKKVVVLGDMLELGMNSPFWHRQLGRFLRKVPSLKHAIFVGDLVKWTSKTVPVGLAITCVSDWKEAITQLNEILDEESLVLVKGSNGMGLTNLVREMADK